MGPRVVVVGSLNGDLVVRARRFPLPGETLLGESFEQFLGGKGANQAIRAQEMGARTSMIGRVGKDLLGQTLLSHLGSYGIQTKEVTVSDTSSGVASIFLEETGQNRIVVVEGANKTLGTEHLDCALSTLQSADVVLFQLEIPMEVVCYGVSLCKGLGIPVILNPAPARELSKALLLDLDVITPNETEATFLTGCKEYKEAACVLLSQGVQNVVITLGEKGVYAVNKAEEMEIPGFRVEVCDTTGAGDAFSGVFAYAYAKKEPLKRALLLANGAAALSVTGLSATGVSLREDLVLRFLQEQGISL